VDDAEDLAFCAGQLHRGAGHQAAHRMGDEDDLLAGAHDRLGVGDDVRDALGQLGAGGAVGSAPVVAEAVDGEHEQLAERAPVVVAQLVQEAAVVLHQPAIAVAGRAVVVDLEEIGVVLVALADEHQLAVRRRDAREVLVEKSCGWIPAQVRQAVGLARAVRPRASQPAAHHAGNKDDRDRLSLNLHLMGRIGRESRHWVVDGLPGNLFDCHVSSSAVPAA